MTSMQTKRKLARVILAVACLSLIQCKLEKSASVDQDLMAFFGTYNGTTKNVIKGEISERELSVTIKPWEEKGFTVEWTTVIHRANGEQKKSEPSINFYHSTRPGIYASAMRTDVFGHAVPYDPIDEEAPPYVWAGLEGETLTVTAMYIIDGGGYEMHVYKRSLHEQGLLLEFQRLNDGETVTQVSAVLEPANP